MALGRIAAISLLSLASALWVGCTTVTQTRGYSGGPLPRPGRILVYDFAVSPQDVKLDGGFSARVAEAMESGTRTDQEIAVGRSVANALSEHLVKEISSMGLPAMRAMDAPDDGVRTVSIRGQFVSIDEGNRTERVVIGLGAGRSSVDAEVQVDYDGRVVEQFETVAKSGRKPGAAETLGVGAAAGTLAVAGAVTAASAVGSESFGANVEADASRTAKKLADDLKPFFVRQGWIQ